MGAAERGMCLLIMQCNGEVPVCWAKTYVCRLSAGGVGGWGGGGGLWTLAEPTTAGSSTARTTGRREHWGLNGWWMQHNG